VLREEIGQLRPSAAGIYPSGLERTRAASFCFRGANHVTS
jgi:hypothetical protein